MLYESLISAYLKVGVMLQDNIEKFSVFYIHTRLTNNYYATDIQ